VSWVARPGDYGQGGLPAPGVRRRSGRWWLTAFVLFLAAAASFGLGLRGGQPWLPGPLFGGPAPRTSPPVVSPAARSVPVTLSIPAIGLNTSLSELGMNANHTVQVPADFQEPGWYKFGPSPGQRGSAVILGHVDSYRGPAVFYKLRDLKPGDRVTVTLADHVIAHFEVRQVAMYQKSEFPTDQVYGSHGYSGLQLVTCGGVFDPARGSYLSNVVVYTNLIATS
jgi:LPXTG-site transpeptidase (sortase) family protein